ncbi:MAG: right-handed parallel beta-helix repeat-containing protein, partial [Candidatus Heimdallarchaeaceae archaeon]
MNKTFPYLILLFLIIISIPANEHIQNNKYEIPTKQNSLLSQLKQEKIAVNHKDMRKEYTTNTMHISMFSHEPIIIKCDQDFDKYGFPGSGTEKDPYVIENLSITVTEGCAIDISFTNKSFVISNCYINTTDTTEKGISLSNLINGSYAIKNNTITGGGEFSIYIYNCTNLTVDNNTIDTSQYRVNQGISIVSSSNCTIERNTYLSNCRGIEIYNSIDINIINNKVLNTGIGARVT